MTESCWAGALGTENTSVAAGTANEYISGFVSWSADVAAPEAMPMDGALATRQRWGSLHVSSPRRGSADSGLNELHDLVLDLRVPNHLRHVNRDKQYREQ